MAWTATVTDRKFENGTFYVTVTYTDGVKTHSETYGSVSPSSDWIPVTVRDRLARLAEAGSFDIPVGSVTPALPPQVEANIHLFKSRCQALQTIKVLIDMGVVTADNAKVVALTNWIRNNFSAYIDSLSG